MGFMCVIPAASGTWRSHANSRMGNADREEFAARLDGTSPPIGKNPIDELMAMQDF